MGVLIIILLLLLFIKPIYHGLSDGIKGDNKYRQIYDPSYLITLETLENKRLELEDEITHLETLLKRDFEISFILEKELKQATGNKRVTILNKITTLDKRTHATINKIKQLKDELKELG